MRHLRGVGANSQYGSWRLPRWIGVARMPYITCRSQQDLVAPSGIWLFQHIQGVQSSPRGIRLSGSPHQQHLDGDSWTTIYGRLRHG
jgi:hypothetical protein